eukprot:GHVT01062562.1.p1 GENE.GHVT01062562.1~~GHVT01062562.1.p1  ORF type:complete len:355 (+),score=40.99 GHVT01062562.1:754-1818(+)
MIRFCLLVFVCHFLQTAAYCLPSLASAAGIFDSAMVNTKRKMPEIPTTRNSTVWECQQAKFSSPTSGLRTGGPTVAAPALAALENEASHIGSLTSSSTTTYSSELPLDCQAFSCFPHLASSSSSAAVDIGDASAFPGPCLAGSPPLVCLPLPHVLHRLDVPTTGLVLLSGTSDGARFFSSLQSRNTALQSALPSTQAECKSASSNLSTTVPGDRVADGVVHYPTAMPTPSPHTASHLDNSSEPKPSDDSTPASGQRSTPASSWDSSSAPTNHVSCANTTRVLKCQRDAWPSLLPRLGAVGAKAFPSASSATLCKVYRVLVRGPLTCPVVLTHYMAPGKPPLVLSRPAAEHRNAG